MPRATATEEDRKKLGDLIIAFVSETIYGHERGLYRAGVPVSIGIIQFSAMNYLNGCYKSLILKDDEYVMTKFSEMTDLIGHSEVCLINIIMQIMVGVHTQLDRSKIDTTTLETLSLTVQAETARVIAPLKELVYKCISHECHGEKIEDCDPNEPLFFAKTE
jgi:hypothetical protein